MLKIWSATDSKRELLNEIALMSNIITVKDDVKWKMINLMHLKILLVKKNNQKLVG